MSKIEYLGRILKIKYGDAARAGFEDDKFFIKTWEVEDEKKPEDLELFCEENFYLITDLKKAEIRKLRDKKLAETDWTMLPDVNLTEEKKAEWLEYRKKLRDITKTDGFLNNGGVEWPEIPLK